MCHRCAAFGSWYDLKRRAGSGGALLLTEQDCKNALPPSVSDNDTSRPGALDRTPASLTARRASDSGVKQCDARFQPVPDQRRVTSYQANLMHNPRFKSVKAYLQEERGIQPEVLIKYGVGAAIYRWGALDSYYSSRTVLLQNIVSQQFHHRIFFPSSVCGKINPGCMSKRL